MGFSRQEYWSGLPLPSPGVVRGLRDVESELLLLESNHLSLLRRKEAHHINNNNDNVSSIIIMLAPSDIYWTLTI